jgi:hypothetical protein
MPRRFGLRTADGTFFRVATTAWELGGLDTLAGSSVTVRNLKRITGDSYWFAADSFMSLGSE